MLMLPADVCILTEDGTRKQLSDVTRPFHRMTADQLSRVAYGESAPNVWAAATIISMDPALFVGATSSFLERKAELLSMSMLGRAVNKAYELIRSTYYEGPDPPGRLKQIVIDFANSHPKATRKQWVAFCSKLADDSYRDGYTRGFEWAERDLDRRDPAVDPSEYTKLFPGQEKANLYDGSHIPDDGKDDSSNLEMHEMAYREDYIARNAGVRKVRLWLQRQTITTASL